MYVCMYVYICIHIRMYVCGYVVCTYIHVDRIYLFCVSLSLLQEDWLLESHHSNSVGQGNVNLVQRVHVP